MRRTKNVPHHLNEFEHTIIVDEIKNPIGFLFGAKYIFFSKNGQMLGDIALAGSNLLYNFLYAHRIIAENA